MTIQLFERRAVTRLNRILQSTPPNRDTPLPVRSELFLLAHDEETGRCHLDRHTLERALACAVLLELWITRRIEIGCGFRARDAIWERDPGRIFINDHRPVGDPLTDTAMHLLRHAGGGLHVSDFIRRFAATGLYERVRADMIAGNILKRTVRRRFGLFRTEAYMPVEGAYAIRARFRIRELPTRRWEETGHPDTRTVALAALTLKLGLIRHFNPPDDSIRRVQTNLQRILTRRAGPSITDVINAL